MQTDIFITCALTGAGDTTGRSDLVPVTPAQIAEAAISAAKAGAAVAHIHVRNPETGKPSRDPELYREAVSRIRDSGTDVILNLTAGMGGDLVLGDGENPMPPGPGTDLAGPTERLAHIRELLPEICTLDCGSMNFAAGGNYVMVNPPRVLADMAEQIRQLGVKPEMEIFDTGDLTLAAEMVASGLVQSPPLIQLCMGIPYGMPADLATFASAINRLPPGAVWSSFAIGRMQTPWALVSAFAGGNVRVGLEDNLYLKKGVLATNAQLTENAADILSRSGFNIMTPAQARKKIGVEKRQ